MSPRDPSATNPNISQATVDSVPKQLPAGDQPTVSSDAHPAPAVELVEGTGPELTGEIEDLLRRRLRLAAGLLFAGFAAFLLKGLLQGESGLPEPQWTVSLHAVTTVVLGLVAAGMCRRCRICLDRLRLAELVVFGLPVLFFLPVQYYFILETCHSGFFWFPAGLWLVLIYTYALFIPNTLRRAAVVIGAMAAAPLALLVFLILRDEAVAGCVTADDLTSISLMFVLAAVSGVFGVDTIGSLRREAFEARQLGSYRLTRRIGAGGMGEVYLAEHCLLKRPCVVKLIRPDKAGDQRVLARFQREVRATAKLTHWNTVEIFDYGHTPEGTFYYVMEYLPGMSLAELVERFGPVPPERAVYFLLQACDALSEAHAAGLVHRDVKPGNVFVAQRGGVYDVVKLLDFGLVKPPPTEQAVDLTLEGSITGSPLYMSPEQATGETSPDRRSDIYSLGAVAYFLLTGRPPFVDTRPLKVLIAHAHDPVVPPSQWRSDVPEDLEQVILRCLAKRREERFQTAAELSDALAACGAAGRWTRQHAARWWREHAVDPAPAPAADQGDKVTG